MNHIDELIRLVIDAGAEINYYPDHICIRISSKVSVETSTKIVIPSATRVAAEIVAFVREILGR